MTGFFFVSSGLESLPREKLFALISSQQRQIKDLKSTVTALTDKVRGLESLPRRNSGNSSVPPCSDVFVKSERRKKPSSGRPHGKQPSAGGASLELVERTDRTMDELLSDCTSCGSARPKASARFTHHQCHDISPMGVQVTKTRCHKAPCGCRQVTVAKVPDGVPDCPYYGPQLAVLTVVSAGVPARLGRAGGGADP